MMNYIENMKTKPEHIRKRFAFFTSLGITLVILIGWAATSSLSSSTVVSDEVVETPTSTLTASVSGAFNDIKGILFGSNKAQYSADSVEVTGGKI